MEFKREIMQSGTSSVIRLTAEQMRLYNLIVGEIVDVRIITQKDLDDEDKRRFKQAWDKAKDNHATDTTAELSGLIEVKRGREYRGKIKLMDEKNEKEILKLKTELGK